MELALDIQQSLICHETQTNKQKLILSIVAIMLLSGCNKVLINCFFDTTSKRFSSLIKKGVWMYWQISESCERQS